MSTKKKSNKKKSNKKNSKKKSNKRIVSRKTKSIYNGGGDYIDYKVGEKDSKYIYMTNLLLLE